MRTRQPQCRGGRSRAVPWATTRCRAIPSNPPTELTPHRARWQPRARDIRLRTGETCRGRSRRSRPCGSRPSSPARRRHRDSPGRSPAAASRPPAERELDLCLLGTERRPRRRPWTVADPTAPAVCRSPTGRTSNWVYQTRTRSIPEMLAGQGPTRSASGERGQREAPRRMDGAPSCAGCERRTSGKSGARALVVCGRHPTPQCPIVTSRSTNDECPGDSPGAAVSGGSDRVGRLRQPGRPPANGA